MSEPTLWDSEHVLDWETDQIRRLRAARGVQDWGENTIGLALSGGGIRSATFNLGILQALAEKKVLSYVDYLSTVSGGGYIGSWLVAWIKRTSFKTVEDALAGSIQNDLNRPATSPIDFLRDYSNYLTPRLGALSADAWAGVAIFLRNLLLNFAICVSLFAGLLLLPYLPPLVLSPVDSGPRSALSTASPGALVLGLFFGFVSLIFLFIHLNKMWETGQARPDPQWKIVLPIALPLLLEAIVLTYWLSANACWRANKLLPTWWQQWLLPLVIGFDLAYWLVLSFIRPEKLKRLPLYSAIAGLAIVSLVANWWVLSELYNKWYQDPAFDFKVSIFGVPLFLLVTLAAAGLHVGLAGMLFRNQFREWTARMGAWVLIVTLSWFAIFGLALYGSLLAIWTAGCIGEVLTLAWLIHSVAGVVSAYSGATGKPGSFGWREVIALTAPWVFAIGLFVLLSFGIYRVLPGWISSQKNQVSSTFTLTSGTSKVSVEVSSGQQKRESFGALAARYWRSMDDRKPKAWKVLIYFFALIAFGIGLSKLVNVNDFSMHLFYRNRLVRCYLGASRPPENSRDPCARAPNRFSGFDPRDDLFLACLATEPANQPDRNASHNCKCQCADERDCECKCSCYSGPYPILNATVNLTHGEKLAWQERKAEAFVFTPLYCGIPQANNGAGAYGPTKEYNYGKDGPYLGTALAISGAAVSPFIGFHSSAAAGFLLTLFNARLSQWMAHPSGSRWNKFGPRLAMLWLFRELFGLTDENRAYVCLSDGGQFENLGIYELVRRKVKYIIACDATADPELKFGDLGNAIRKCRADLGVEITIDPSTICRNSKGFSEHSYALGTINYGPRGHGVLIYLKASLTGNEPLDVLAYHCTHSQFPHEPTADQWFDESQFESYRRLGQYIAETVFPRPLEPEPLADRDDYFRRPGML